MGQVYDILMEGLYDLLYCIDFAYLFFIYMILYIIEINFINCMY